LDDKNKMGLTYARVAKARKQSNKLCQNETGAGYNSFIFVKVVSYAGVAKAQAMAKLGYIIGFYVT